MSHQTGIPASRLIPLPPRPPLLIVLSGPSGVGKDATLKRMQQKGHAFHFVVTHTTRPRRPSEVEGVDYRFTSEEQYDEMLARDEFLEHATVYGYRYGNSRLEVREALARGRDVMLRIDVQGAATIRRKVPQAIFIFLLPSSLDELEQRLRARRTEDESKLRLRLATAEKELEQLTNFDYYVFNRAGELDATVSQIEAIISAEKAKVHPRVIEV